MPLSFQNKIQPVTATAPALSFASKIKPIEQPEQPSFGSRVGGALAGVGKFLASSEIAVGNDLTAGIRANMQAKNQTLLLETQLKSEKGLKDIIDARKAAGQDTSHFEQALASIKLHSIAPKPDDFEKAVPEVNKTSLQGIGDVLGVGADVLSAGSYGAAAKGAKSGALLVKGGGLVEKAALKAGIPTTQRIISEVAKDTGKKALGETLKTIGKQTAVRTATGGATGYGLDVIQNLKQGETGGDILKPGLGTATGVILPIAIGSIRAGTAITKDLAPRVINGLVKPKTANFAYGKNPGRTVSSLGVTGNNMEDFANNINTAKKDVGQKIGAIYDNPLNADARINASDEIAKIDDAIAKAAKGGKNNQDIVNKLNNIKDSLLYDHSVSPEGVITKSGEKAVTDTVDRHLTSASQALDSLTQDAGKAPDAATMSKLLESTKNNIVMGLQREGKDAAANNINKIDVSKFKSIEEMAQALGEVSATPRDLSNLTTKEGFALKQKVSEATQFTGRESDDKTVNSVLKDIYSGIKTKLNKSVSPNNPEIIKFNEMYGDLTSAELAARNRNAIIQRSAFATLPVKIGTATALITALASGGAAIPSILAGVAAGALDKGVQSTAVQSRIAAWLGKESPSTIAKVLEKNPQIAPILRRVFPLMASKLGN